MDEGGLGLRLFTDMVNAFSCKLWWKLRKYHSILADFMHSKYIKGLHPTVVEVERPPGSWRRLLSVRTFAEKNIFWNIGEGIVDFWYDWWCGDKPLMAELGIQDPPHMLVGEFFVGENWDLPRLRHWLPEPMVWTISVIIVDSSFKDSMVWQGSPSGDFATSVAWEQLRQRRSGSLVDKLLWSRVLWLKISVFA